jgi:hypothetical protein
MKPKLKPPGTKRVELKWDILLSSFAFKLNLRRYTWGGPRAQLERRRVEAEAGRCSLTLSGPR